MGWHWESRVTAMLLVAMACGTTSGDGDDGSTSTGLADSSSSTSADTTASSSSGDASSSSGAPPTSESSSSADSSTGEPSGCDCADDEICVEANTDGCFDPHTPSLTCVPIPASCDGIEPACETECGWDICGGPSCSGPGANVCNAPSPGFVCGSFDTTCNLFDSDCAETDKCTSWDDDQDGTYNDTRCGPVGPVLVGEPCTSKGSHGSGVDDCEAGAMCLSDDISQTEGICRAACMGNPYDASCADPEMQCVLEGFWFGWCLPA